MLFTAYSGGLRVSEIVNLKIADIDSQRMQRDVFLIIFSFFSATARPSLLTEMDHFAKQGFAK